MQYEILMPWKAKNEYLPTKYKKSRQMNYELKLSCIAIVEYFGLGTTRKKLETLRQQFTVGTKNNLSWKFLLLAMVRIHFGKPKIHLSSFLQYLK